MKCAQMFGYKLKSQRSSQIFFYWAVAGCLYLQVDSTMFKCYNYINSLNTSPFIQIFKMIDQKFQDKVKDKTDVSPRYLK